MGIFNKKKKQAEAPVDIEEILKLSHKHVWKDMPWYMDVHYSGRDKTADYSIIEPYICITCGERKNKVLETISWANISPEDREKEYAAVRKRYKKYLRPRAVVEDMINNILLVKDPDALESIEKMMGLPHSNVGTSAGMKRIMVEQPDHPIIEVEENETTN